MDSSTTDLDAADETGSGDSGSVPVAPPDAAQRAKAAGVGPDLLRLDQELAARSRRNGRRALVFVLVLTGAVMAFAIVVVVWMYWLAPALAF